MFVIDRLSGFRRLFFSIALLVLLASCMNEDENLVNKPVELAYVSIYHASPDAPAFDIFVDNRIINQNPLNYSSYSGYLNFFTGHRNIRVNSTHANHALIDTTFNFEKGEAYSLFAINRVSGIEALLVADRAAIPSEGKAMVRFVHLSPDAPALNVELAGDTKKPLFRSKSFRDATPFEEIDGGLYSFVVKKAAASETVVSATDVEILPGRYYTIVTRGFMAPASGNTNVLTVEVID
jgi:hypothetical protein